jgi:hypothetical protein
MRRANPYYKPDAVILVGQSNSMFSSSPESSWPLWQQSDKSSLHCMQYYGLIDATESWGSMRQAIIGRGGFPWSLAAHMRHRGMVPAICQSSLGGTASAYWNTNAASVSAWIAARRAELTSPHVRAIVIYQGEDEAAGIHSYTTWRANWEAFVAAMRAAVSLPVLPVIVVKIPSNYTNYPDLVPLRAAQDAMVAADAHAVSVDCYPLPGFVDADHLDFAGIDTTARLVAAAIP